MRNFLLVLIFCNLFICETNSQVSKLTLNDVIILAKTQSPDALLAKHRFRSSYWKYRSFKASYLPSLSLNATIPDFNKTITPILQDDGSVRYIDKFDATYSADLMLSKVIGFTGGSLFMTSGYQQYDVFTDSTTISTYYSTPVNIGYRQPLFAYNQYKWDKKLQPIMYEEAKRKYLQDVEEISLKAVDAFFGLLSAQITLKVAEKNQANNDTLYQIAVGRYGLGKIAENELLQMELSLLNSNVQLEQAKVSLEAQLNELRSFLGIKENEMIELIIPENVPDLQIEYERAIEQALKNTPDILGFERELIAAESNLNKEKAENRFNADLYAVYGLTDQAATIEDVYVDPRDNQRLSVGISIPILDWGVGKGKVKMAESNLELSKTKIEQDQIDFKHNVMLRIMEFNMLGSQVNVAAKADTVAQKRFEISKQRYYIGKIGITDLNIATTEKDNAKKQYMDALRRYWHGYYIVRRITLYDFTNNMPIITDFEAIR